MDDKTLIEVIKAAVREETAPIHERLDKLEANMATKAELSDLQQQITRVAIFQENTVIKRLDSLADGITGVGQKFARLDRLEDKVEDHSHRIFALESVIKAR